MKHSSRSGPTDIILVCFLSFLPILGTAQAQSIFAVNSTLDSVDAHPGDHICADANCLCTLRAAIMEANASPGADTIYVPSGNYGLTLTSGTTDPAFGDLDITDSVTINGSGAGSTIIKSLNGDRVIEVQPQLSGMIVILNDVTITGGSCSCNGGGIAHAGGTLTLNRAIVSNNTAANFGGISSKNGDTLTLNFCIVANNTALNNYGAIYKLFGTLRISDSTVRGNHAGQVSGVYSGGAITTIRNSTIDNNGTTGFGGYAGGVLNDCVNNPGNTPTIMTIENSTISGNKVSVDGGGIYNRGGCPGSNVAILILNSSTIAFNKAGGLGGGVRNDGGTVSLTNNIIASNFGSPADCSGPISSSDYNLYGTPTCVSSAQHDVVNSSVGLLPLALNGGSTLTHALSASSPGLDTGTCALPLDQRGVQRPQPSSTNLCDRGSYEGPP